MQNSQSFHKKTSVEYSREEVSEDGKRLLLGRFEISISNGQVGKGPEVWFGNEIPVYHKTTSRRDLSKV